MRRTVCFVGLVVLACSCTPSVKTLTVDPEAETLGAKGARTTFRAIAKDAKGQRIVDLRTQPKWSSSAPSVATVDEAGKATAVKSGDTVITAVLGELKGEARLKVSIPATLALTPATIEFKAPGERAVLEAKLVDDVGRPLAAKGVDWDTSDPKVARVTGGHVSAVGPGTATITATMDVIKGQATVTLKRTEAPPFAKLVVKPTKVTLKKGSSAKLAASALDKKNKPVADVPVTWSTSSAKIATVEAGTVTAVKKGKATITAAAGRKTAKVKVTVK